MTRHKTLVSWSSGKDCAWALHRLRQDPQHEVVGLLSTVTAAYDRVSMHAVRRALLASQAAALGLPVVEVLLPTPCSNEAYAEVMGRAVAEQVAQGISHIAFGDLFLEDVRRYREEKLAGTGLTPVFPLWQQPTAQLAREMLAAGVRAVITCVDPRQVDPGLCGRDWDAALIAALPPEADPCGERGEFHTFVWDGPMFLHGPVKFERGEVVLRDGFVFADLFPADSH